METNQPAPATHYRPTLYSTWLQVPKQGKTRHFIVIAVRFHAGQIIEYDLMAPWPSPVIETMPADKLCALIQQNLIVEWKM
jgi:hypothetical protein